MNVRLLPARLLRLGLFAALAVLDVGTRAHAAEAQPDPEAPLSRIEDRRQGEGDRIERRHEWFFSTRRAGAESADELRRLRLAGVEDTRRALEAQRARRARGQEPGQNFWVSQGPSPSNFGTWAFGTVSGRIQAIAADWASGTLYVGGGSGGVWRSTNNGASWTSIFDTAGTTAVGAITVDPNDPDVLWVGTGDNVSGCESYFGIGLLRSTDGGVTWEARNGSGGATLQDLSSFATVIVDPRDSNHLVVGGRYRGCVAGSALAGGLYTSNDGGATWTHRLTAEVHEVAQDPNVLDVFWASTGSGVFKSVDNGVTWLLQTASGLPSGGVGRAELAIAPSESNTVYVLFATGPSFWRTTDGGATWSQRSNGSSACDGQCWYNMTLRVHPTDPDIVYRGTVRLFKSTNGGTSWTDLVNSWGSSQKVHQDIHSLLVHPTAGNSFYVGGDGGIWQSHDGGANFTNSNGNLNVTQFYAIGVDANDPARICGGAQDNSSLARTTSDVWNRQAVTGDGFVCMIDPVDPSYAFITSYPSSGFPNVWRSISGLFGPFGSVTNGNGITNGDRIAWVTPYLLDPVSPNIVYLGTHRVYRSIDHGSSWTQVGPTDLTIGGVLISLEVNREHPTYVYSGSNDGRVWRSADSGTAWTDITAGLPFRSINDIAGDPTNPQRAFAVVGGFNTAHVWEWNDGAGWTAHNVGLPNVPHNSVVMLSDADILVGTDVGVFRSQDGGETFVPFMDGLPEGLVVTDLKYTPGANVVTAGTYGRGAWQIDLGVPQAMLVADPVEQPLVELNGDGDGKLEPGETFGVRPVLRNVGGMPALDASARVTTSTPGVTFLDSGVGQYGSLAPGASAASQTLHSFVVDPGVPCGSTIALDLVELTTSNEPLTHDDQPGVLSLEVRGSDDDPTVEPLVAESFDPAPTSGWNHEGVSANLPECQSASWADAWNLATKDAAHGLSFHAGNGAGSTYARSTHAWLYPFGKDSAGGAGLVVPAEALAATLTIEHWYETVLGQDGGVVVIDAVDNDQDVFTPLTPAGGYPGAPLPLGVCNALGGRAAFQGSSGGWTTTTFDLSPYKGSRVYLAFVFGSDRNAQANEGWYIDGVTIEYLAVGAALCDVAKWPGSVATSQFERVAPDAIRATWSDACNAGDFPEQGYSIQAGDLDLLRDTLVYTHAPVDDRCDWISSDTFTPGLGNEYYLIIPSAGGREGGAGADGLGAARPQTTTLCGERRVACP